MATSSINCDVVVIGGGLSGLTAAYHLKKRNPNMDVVVLEAKPRVGGRTLTVDMNVAGGRKAKFDLGGQWVGPLQTDLLELMKELNMSELLYHQWTEGIKVCWIDPGRIVRYNYDLPFVNPLILLEALFLFRKIEKISDQLDTDNPFLRNPALAEYLDSITVEAFIRENIYSASLREMVRVAMRSAFGMEASQMSALYMCLYGKSSGSLENVISSTNNGCQKWRVRGGTQQISDRLADFVGRDKVYLGSPVTSINQESPDSVEITAYMADGTKRRFISRRAILAIPPSQILPLSMSPPLNGPRTELMRSMPMGNIFKFMITYEKAFWRDKKLSGETVCYGGEDGVTGECPVGAVAISFDATLVDGTPALVGFMGGHQTLYWRQRTPLERRNAILSTLAKMLGDEALKPVDFREKDWGLEQFTGGCPVNVLQPGAGRFYTSSLRLPIGNVYLAGTESAQRSCGFLSGAVQAGRRAATEVLISLEKHSALDNAILPTTCFGNSGKAMNWPQKWLTTADPYVGSMGKPNWALRILFLLGTFFVVRRHVWPRLIGNGGPLHLHWEKFLAKYH